MGLLPDVVKVLGVAVGAAGALVGCSDQVSTETLNPSVPVTTSRLVTIAGVFLVQGAILDEYEHCGGREGWLGDPTTSEKPAPRHGRLNDFQHGSIYWTKRTGAHAIAGQTLWAWNIAGGAIGPLGYPTGDPQPVPGGGTQTRFEHGAISDINGHTDTRTTP